MNVYLTNLGKYNEGELIGKWLELPLDESEIQRAMDEIGINEDYEEYFLTDWECSPVDIWEYDDIYKLNEMAQELEELNQLEQETIEFLMKYMGFEWDMAIKKVKESDYTVYGNIGDETDLGHEIAQDWEIPEHLQFYIDYGSIGHDCLCSGWVLYGNNAYYVY